MRIAPAEICNLCEADQIEEFARSDIRCRATGRPIMQLQRFCNLVADSHAGVEGRRRILWDEADTVAAQPVEGEAVETKQIFALEENPPAFDAGIVGTIAKERQSSR